MGTKESDVKFDFDPWDGTPGDAYDKFEIRLLNNGSKTDDRGWSLSDHLLGDDEGGPNIGAPAMPAGPPAQLLKAQQARRKRQKESYGILAKHVTNKDITEDLQRNHFQDGRAAFLAIRASGQVAVDHEAESAQASRAAKAGIYVRQLLINNGRKLVGPTLCLGDNKANDTTSQQLGSTART